MNKGSLFPTVFASILLTAAIPGLLKAQGVYMGTQDTDPESETILELESSTKGFLLPRLTAAQILAISSPAEGLMVYNSDGNQVIYYNGTSWMNGDGSKSFVEVGDEYQGGIVFEVDGTGLHGKIAALADVGTAVPWGCEGTPITSGNGAASTTDGAANTSAIMTDCGTAGSAAELCDSYEVTEGVTTYDDWYLPAEDELSTLYSVRNVVGGFDGFAYYWSSTETDDNNARMINFANGSGTNGAKNDTDTFFGFIDYDARPIRAF